MPVIRSMNGVPSGDTWGGTPATAAANTFRGLSEGHRFTGFWHPVAWAVLVQGATPSTRSVKVPGDAAARFGPGSSLGEEGVELLVALDHAVLHAAGDHPVATLHGVDDR